MVSHLVILNELFAFYSLEKQEWHHYNDMNVTKKELSEVIRLGSLDGCLFFYTHSKILDYFDTEACDDWDWYERCAIDENRMYFQIAIIGKIEFMFNVVSKMKFSVNLKVHDSFDVWLNEALCM